MKHLIAILFVLRISSAIDLQAQTSQGIQMLNQQIDSVWELMIAEPEAAQQLALTSMEKAKSIGFEKGRADCANALGVLFLEQQKFSTASHYFNISLNLRIQLKDLNGQASVLHNLAALLADQGDYPEAIKKAFAAIKIWERLQETNHLGIVYNTLSNIYMSNGDYDLGLAYTKMSVDILKQTDDHNALADARYNLAERYYQLGDLDQARKLFEATLILYRDSFFDPGAQADVFNALGAIAMEKGEFTKADTYFYESEVKYKVIGDSIGLFDVYTNLGLLEEVQQNFGKAIEFYQKAEQTLGEEASLENQQYLMEQYVAVYQSLGDFKRAFGFQKKAEALHDSIFNEKKQLQIASLQVSFEAEKLAKENITQRIQNQQKTFQRNVFMLATGGLVLLLLVGIFAWSQHQKASVFILQQREMQHQREIGALLKEQEYQLVRGRLDGQVLERQRLALEVNDGLASKIAAVNWHLEALKDQVGDKATHLNKIQKVIKGIFLQVNHLVEQIKTTEPNGEGLEKALEKLKTIVEKESQLKANIQLIGLNKRINPQIEIAIYRILRELVANVIKHAKASELNIHLHQLEGHLSIMVEDNGRGFDPKHISYFGLGLKRLELLIQGLEGVFSIDSGLGGGTTIMIDLPV